MRARKIPETKRHKQRLDCGSYAANAATVGKKRSVCEPVGMEHCIPTKPTTVRIIEIRSVKGGGRQERGTPDCGVPRFLSAFFRMIKSIDTAN